MHASFTYPSSVRVLVVLVADIHMYNCNCGRCKGGELRKLHPVNVAPRLLVAAVPRSRTNVADIVDCDT
jgi:hypothetical protein